MKVLSTPCGIRFGVFGEVRPLAGPTLFVFASKIEETLGAYFNNCGRILAKDGFISVALDLPCHGEDSKVFLPHRPAVRPADAAKTLCRAARHELDGWRTRLERGDNFVPGFLAKASKVLDYLVEHGHTDPSKVAACGTSRGGFISLHFAAVEARVKCVAAFGPVTDLRTLREFAGMERHGIADSLALVNIAEKLAGRPVWLCIGNNDERVGTDKAIGFTRKLVEAALRPLDKLVAGARRATQGGAELGLRRAPSSRRSAAVALRVPAPVELHVMPVVGHTIHATAHEEAAAWILRQVSEVP